MADLIDPNCKGDVHIFTFEDHNRIVSCTCQCSMLEICAAAAHSRDNTKRYRQISVYIQPGVEG